MSGGSTVRPIARASARKLTTLSVLSMSERQHRGHELGRIVRLQPRGLVRDQRVRGRVRLVEAVAGELLHQVEDRVGLVARSSPFFAAPSRNVARCFAISSAFFLPIARRSRSAPPSE